MHSVNWDDLRYVLAVADTGSVSGAARELGVNHATVLRRIAAFEEAHGGEVFEREAKGYRLRPDRARMIEAARQAAQAMQTVGTLMQGAPAAARDVVRVTSVDTLCQTVLASVGKDEGHQGFALLCSNGHLDLARLQADIAVRPALALPGDMRGTEAGAMRFAVYAQKGADTEAWLGLCGPLARSMPAEWMMAHVPPEAILHSADSFVVLREMAARGAGQVVLPLVLGEGDARLERRDMAGAPIEVPVWVATHAELAGTPRIRTAQERLVELIRAAAPDLKG